MITQLLRGNKIFESSEFSGVFTKEKRIPTLITKLGEAGEKSRCRNLVDHSR